MKPKSPSLRSPWWGSLFFRLQNVTIVRLQMLKEFGFGTVSAIVRVPEILKKPGANVTG